MLFDCLSGALSMHALSLCFDTACPTVAQCTHMLLNNTGVHHGTLNDFNLQIIDHLLHSFIIVFLRFALHLHLLVQLLHLLIKVLLRFALIFSHPCNFAFNVLLQLLHLFVMIRSLFCQTVERSPCSACICGLVRPPSRALRLFICVWYGCFLLLLPCGLP